MTLAGPVETVVTKELVRQLLDETVENLVAESAYDAELLNRARQVFEQVALADDFPDFLTLPAYDLLP